MPRERVNVGRTQKIGNERCAGRSSGKYTLAFFVGHTPDLAQQSEIASIKLAFAENHFFLIKTAQDSDIGRGMLSAVKLKQTIISFI
jgi:hypothetical protein